jgi:inosine-uridine nucleoside N-ribohydrolase
LQHTAIDELARSRGVEIAGISTVYGNAPIEITDRTTRELVALLEREGEEVGDVHRGAGQASDTMAPDAAPPAQTALREALGKGPLTIVALAPLTNVAAALADRPDLQGNVARLIMVMGRTPGHLFHPSEGAGGGLLFGHGPVFRDFNFDQDPNAVALGRMLFFILTSIIAFTYAWRKGVFRYD